MGTTEDLQQIQMSPAVKENTKSFAWLSKASQELDKELSGMLAAASQVQDPEKLRSNGPISSQQILGTLICQGQHDDQGQIHQTQKMTCLSRLKGPLLD